MLLRTKTSRLRKVGTCTNMIPYFFYIAGSICFIIGSVIGMLQL